MIELKPVGSVAENGTEIIAHLNEAGPGQAMISVVADGEIAVVSLTLRDVFYQGGPDVGYAVMAMLEPSGIDELIVALQTARDKVADHPPVEWS